MTMDVFKGEFTSDQFRIPEGYRARPLSELEDGERGYAYKECFWMDTDGLPWFDANTACYGRNENLDDRGLELVKVYKLPEGFVLDFADCLDYFVGPDDAIAFEEQTGPTYARENNVINKQPVIHLIFYPDERAQFQFAASVNGFSFSSPAVQELLDSEE